MKVLLVEKIKCSPCVWCIQRRLCCTEVLQVVIFLQREVFLLWEPQSLYGVNFVTILLQTNNMFCKWKCTKFQNNLKIIKSSKILENFLVKKHFKGNFALRLDFVILCVFTYIVSNFIVEILFIFLDLFLQVLYFQM